MLGPGKVAEEVEHVGAGFRVEVARGFIGQDQGSLAGKRRAMATRCL